MATYRLSVSTVSRSTGRSAVAAAAYRSASCLTNERDGVTHDYRSRTKDVLARGIVAPDHAPEWACDRARLWNAAEAAENRKNSVTAREVQLSLPHELTDAQRLELVNGFCARLVERYGVAVDFAIHRPDAKGDNRNHHAHVLMTTRRMGADGLGEKTRELDDRSKHANGTKPRGPQEVEFLRQTWCALENQALEKARIAERVDHRSYERQGLDREPEPRLGPHAHAMQERGKPTLKGEWRAAVRAGDELAAERAAILYHVRQVEAHEDKHIPERSRSAKGRQWPYEGPPRPPRSLKGPQRPFTAMAPRPAQKGRGAPEPVPAPKAPPSAPRPLPEPLAGFAARPLAKTWREHYQQTRENAKQLSEVQAWQRQQLEAQLKPAASFTPSPQRGNGLAGLFKRLTVSRSEEAARQLAQQRAADRAREQLAALEKKQAAEREALAAKEQERRKALARQLAKTAREQEKASRERGRIRRRDDDRTPGLELERDRTDELRRRKRPDYG